PCMGQQPAANREKNRGKNNLIIAFVASISENKYADQHRQGGWKHVKKGFLAPERIIKAPRRTEMCA
ncbi:hypothetical protein, partial [Piscirickettsia salmonis]|uniref:hypothetical protein n=1 Tax=Piscirickettsia salmonis TaxID=1238 RepID=UPI00050A21E7